MRMQQNSSPCKNYGFGLHLLLYQLGYLINISLLPLLLYPCQYITVAFASVPLSMYHCCLCFCTLVSVSLLPLLLYLVPYQCVCSWWQVLQKLSCLCGCQVVSSEASVLSSVFRSTAVFASSRQHENNLINLLGLLWQVSRQRHCLVLQV